MTTYWTDHDRPCRDCKGKGRVVEDTGWGNVTTTCWGCGGTGAKSMILEPAPQERQT